jgi:hypothetical protein
VIHVKGVEGVLKSIETAAAQCRADGDSPDGLSVLQKETIAVLEGLRVALTDSDGWGVDIAAYRAALANAEAEEAADANPWLAALTEEDHQDEMARITRRFVNNARRQGLSDDEIARRARLVRDVLVAEAEAEAEQTEAEPTPEPLNDLEAINELTRRVADVARSLKTLEQRPSPAPIVTVASEPEPDPDPETARKEPETVRKEVTRDQNGRIALIVETYSDGKILHRRVNRDATGKLVAIDQRWVSP